MSKRTVNYFIKQMTWVDSITDGYSRADETGVLIAEAKRHPDEALAACKRKGGSTSRAIDRAVREHLAKTGQAIPDTAKPQSAPRKRSASNTLTQNEVTANYDETRVKEYINRLNTMRSTGDDFADQRKFQQFLNETKRHPADALEAATRLQNSSNRFGYQGLFIREITSRFKKANSPATPPPNPTPKPAAPPASVPNVSQDIPQQPIKPPMELPKIQPIDMSTFNPTTKEEPEKPTLTADMGAMEHIENLVKPSRSKAFKESFAVLKAMGDDVIEIVLVATQKNEQKYASIAPELMRLLGEINTPKAIDTLQTLRTEGASVAVQMAAIRVLKSIGK